MQSAGCIDFEISVQRAINERLWFINTMQHCSDRILKGCDAPWIWPAKGKRKNASICGPTYALDRVGERWMLHHSRAGWRTLDASSFVNWLPARAATWYHVP